MKKKTLRLGFSLVIIIVAVILSVILLSHKPKAEKSQEGIIPVIVKTKLVSNEEINPVLAYPGRVNSFENVSISAEVNGRIMKGRVPLKEGQSFTKGQLLMQIFGEDTKASLKASRSSFLKTLSLVLPDIHIDYPESYSKWKDFFYAIDINEELPELPQIENESEKIFMVSNGIITEFYSIQQLEINMSKYRIFAPFDGVYKSVSKEVGSFAANGIEIAQIIRTDKLEIVVPVAIIDIDKIETGNEVRLVSGNIELTGKVSRCSSFVDVTTQSINVYITYKPTHKNKLFEGELIDVYFDTSISSLGTAIPREAFIGDNSVYLVENNRLKKKHVTLLQECNDVSYVSGLNNKDIVVTESLVNVKEGQSVMLLEN